MSQPNQQIYLARHGQTAWSMSGQHTGLSDIPLTKNGEQDGVRLGKRLHGLKFAQVWTSPLQRALRTSVIAGFTAKLDPDLVEWNYGKYEGLTSVQIRQLTPGWNIFRDGCPEGESVAAIGARADRVIARWQTVPGDILVFSSAHILRVLAARWLGLDPSGAKYLFLQTGSLSILGYEHGASDPVIRLWNEVNHLA